MEVEGVDDVSFKLEEDSDVFKLEDLDFGEPSSSSMPVEKPKKARSAYIIFTCDFRAKMRLENSSLLPKDVTVMASARWKQMGPEERAPFMKMAQLERADWELRNNEWKRQNPNKPLYDLHTRSAALHLYSRSFDRKAGKSLKESWKALSPAERKVYVDRVKQMREQKPRKKREPVDDKKNANANNKKNRTEEIVTYINVSEEEEKEEEENWDNDLLEVLPLRLDPSMDDDKEVQIETTPAGTEFRLRCATPYPARCGPERYVDDILAVRKWLTSAGATSNTKEIRWVVGRLVMEDAPSSGQVRVVASEMALGLLKWRFESSLDRSYVQEMLGDKASAPLWSRAHYDVRLSCAPSVAVVLDEATLRWSQCYEELQWNKTLDTACVGGVDLRMGLRYRKPSEVPESALLNLAGVRVTDRASGRLGVPENVVSCVHRVLTRAFPVPDNNKVVIEVTLRRSWMSSSSPMFSDVMEVALVCPDLNKWTTEVSTTEPDFAAYSAAVASVATLLPRT